MPTFDGCVARSTDGVSWDSLQTPWDVAHGGGPTNEVVWSIAKGPARWVALGNTDQWGTDTTRVITSDDDGETWTERSSPFDTLTNWPGPGEVVWNGAVFLASWQDFTLGFPFSGRLMWCSSPDGITWTTVRAAAAPGAQPQFLPITWADDLWVIAVGEVSGPANPGCGVFTSPDLVTWTRQFGGPAFVTSIAWNGSAFLFTQSVGGDYALYSWPGPGHAFTAIPSPLDVIYFGTPFCNARSSNWDGRQWVVGAGAVSYGFPGPTDAGVRLITTPDLSSFTSRAIPGNHQINGLATDGTGRWVAAAAAGVTIPTGTAAHLSPDDAVTWLARPVGRETWTGYEGQCVAHDPDTGLWMVGGTNFIYDLAGPAGWVLGTIRW